MIDRRTLDNCLFLDVETATGYPNYKAMLDDNPRLAILWSKRAKYYRSAYTELNDSTDDEIYLSKASLEPEFLRVVCVSFGVLDGNNGPRYTSFYGVNEKDILDKASKVLSNASLKGMKLTGHNIKGFDIPCLGKRMIFVNKSASTLPSSLIIWNKKPWEIPYLDTSEIFSFGSWSQQKYMSLDLLACSLGVDSPKDDMDGSMVSDAYWNKSQYELIKEYCERDVGAVIEVLLTISE